MRRRRQGLQVSTFPFLAVLLCAMGSLILLLLVIDRRAKVVMRAKALEAIRQMETEEEKVVADRDAEWERRRRELHEKLQQQKQEVDSQTVSLEKQLTAVSRDLQSEQARGPVLDHQLQTEKESLMRQENAVASRVQETAQKKQQSEAAQAGLVRLTADLVQMEQTLADLKALRQRQQQTYSLVPYRGRRGDNRRPIYLECAAGSLIFHPDRWTLPATESSGSALLQEVERRINPRPSTGEAETRKKDTPYLLLLVRPDGIVTYYRTLTALRNLQVDFGYEFVEPDWILSFPEDEKVGATQPWMATGPLPPTDNSVSRRPIPSGRPRADALANGASDRIGEPPNERNDHPGNSASGTSGRIGRQASGGGDRPSISASGASDRPGFRPEFDSQMGPPSVGSFSSTDNGIPGALGNGRPMGRGVAGTRSIAELPTGQVGDSGTGNMGTSLDSTNPTRTSPRASGVTLGKARPRGVSFAGTSGANGMSQNDDLGNGLTGGNETAGSLSSNLPGVPDTGPVKDRGDNSPRSPDGGPELFSRDPIGERASPASGPGTTSIFAKNDLGSSASGSGNPSPLSGNSTPTNGGIPNAAPQTNTAGPQPAPSLIPSFASPSSNASGREVPLSPGQAPGGGEVKSSNSGRKGSSIGAQVGSADSTHLSEDSRNEEAGPQLPGSSGLSRLGQAPEKKSASPAIIHRYVRRDWNIFVECTADQVVVYPGGSRISTISLGHSGKPGNQPLFQTVQQMIARRQAVIASTDVSREAPGQAPQIRFLVRPDGLRTYFLAFPELSPLHLPMTRENLDAEEDAVRHMQGR